MIDIERLTDDELRNLIANHQAKGAMDRPAYQAAVQEMHRRHGGALDIDTSVAYLRVAAADRRFVSYGELAQANGAVWDKVRYPMNTHLWALVCLARARGWPMLSAMIVNKDHVATGEMGAPTLAGFTKAALDLGYDVPKPAAFLKEQQEACFRWGGAADG